MNAPANNLGQIRKLPIFADLTEEELTEIDQLTDEVHIEQGRTIMRQGDLGQEFALIVSGEANIDRRGYNTLLDDIPRLARALLRGIAHRLAEREEEIDQLRVELARQA